MFAYFKGAEHRGTVLNNGKRKAGVEVSSVGFQKYYRIQWVCGFPNKDVKINIEQGILAVSVCSRISVSLRIKQQFHGYTYWICT